MISVIYSTREDNQKHLQHIKDTCGVHKMEVIQYINNGEYSLTELYNKALQETTNNIVVFCHDDIIFETKNWGRKILKHFKRNPQFGIIGIAGSTFLPKSGKWWEIPYNMRGVVNHKSNGKKWESRYSKEIGNSIYDVTIVDGLFFSVNKNKLKNNFDENVKGFHFYDINFCFDNFVKGVKIGVITDVRVTHLSIGETNDEWEQNRKIFSEKYKDNLPVKIDKTFNGNERFNVLLCSTKINDIIQIARQLKGKKYTISVCSEPNKNGLKVLDSMGIKFCHIGEPPGYKMGDGKWGLKTPNGYVLSEPQKLYRIHEVNFDLVHVKNDNMLYEHISRFYPELPIIKHKMSIDSVDEIITEYQKVLS